MHDEKETLRKLARTCSSSAASSQVSVSDLISRKKLLERIDGIWDCNDMTFRPNDKCCNVPDDCKGCKWAETKDAIRRIIENFPAVQLKTKR